MWVKDKDQNLKGSENEYCPQAKENLRTPVMSRDTGHSLMTRGWAHTRQGWLTVCLLGTHAPCACQARETTKNHQLCAIVFYLLEQCKGSIREREIMQLWTQEHEQATFPQSYVFGSLVTTSSFQLLSWTPLGGFSVQVFYNHCFSSRMKRQLFIPAGSSTGYKASISHQEFFK